MCPASPAPNCASCPIRDLTIYKSLLMRRAFAVESIRDAVRTVRKGHVVAKQGAWKKAAYTLRSGWAYRYGETRDGRRQILSLLLPGDFIGLGPAEEQRWTFSVRSLTDVTLCEFPPAGILRELMAAPDTLADVLRACSEAQRDADEIALSLGARTALERITHFILILQRRLARLNPKSAGKLLYFETPLRREDLADALGITGVHVSRSLAKLRSLGVMDFNRGAISIFDETALRHLAAC